MRLYLKIVIPIQTNGQLSQASRSVLPEKTYIEVMYNTINICGQPRIELGWGKPFCPYRFGPHGWKRRE